jgi:hypothetical protein
MPAKARCRYELGRAVGAPKWQLTVMLGRSVPRTPCALNACTACLRLPKEEPGRRAAAHLLTRDEARRIAANIAKLPWAKIDGAPNGSR